MSDPAGRTPLHYAALENNVAEAKSLIDAGASVSEQDREGFTPLHFACQQDNFEVAQILLAAGAPVDSRDSFGDTPLWRAVFAFRGGTPRLVGLLLNAGADPDAKNDSGRSPRDMALTFRRPGIETYFA